MIDPPLLALAMAPASEPATPARAYRHADAASPGRRAAQPHPT